MDDTLLELQTSLRSLPGWKSCPPGLPLRDKSGEWTCGPFSLPDTGEKRRTSDGMSWIWTEEGWVVDLHDLGNAGIMLGMLHETRRCVTVTPHVVYPGWYIELDTDPVGEPSIANEHLGVAVAEALVAIGRSSGSKRCLFEGWGSTCGSETQPGTSFCKMHTMICVKCGEPATHGCNLYWGSGVCGSGLCAEHKDRDCPNHKG